MLRFTTPTHYFPIIGISGDMLSKIRISYAQSGQLILTKTESDCTIDGNEISVKLTQAETARFKARIDVKIQLRVLTTDGTALASEEFSVPVEDVLNTEVL